MNYVLKDKAEREEEAAFQAEVGMYKARKAWKRLAGLEMPSSLVLIDDRITASSISQQERN